MGQVGTPEELVIWILQFFPFAVVTRRPDPFRERRRRQDGAQGARYIFGPGLLEDSESGGVPAGGTAGREKINPAISQQEGETQKQTV